MENIRNLELARLHKEICTIRTALKHLLDQDEKLNLDIIEQLATIETRMHNLAYGDCHFVHRLPYPVKTSVKRKQLHIFPKKEIA